MQKLMDMQFEQAKRLYTILLFAYPESYKEAYAPLMLQIFGDLYAMYAKKKLQFWYIIIKDYVLSIVHQYIYFIFYSMENTYNYKVLLLAFILMIPAMLLLTFGIVFQSILHDTQVLNMLYHAPFYTARFILGAIFFPMVFAGGIVLYPLLQHILTSGKHVFSMAFLKQNLFALVIVGFVLGMVGIFFFHDSGSCILQIFHGTKSILYCLSNA